MLLLESVSCENFRSVGEIQTVSDLPSTGLIGMDGLNRTTGGSSASGKSTFLYAISSIIGICPVPASENQSIFTKSKSSLAGVFVDTESGKKIRVAVGKKPSIHEDGVLVKEGTTEVNEYVKTMFGGLSSDVLKGLCFRAQDEGGLFTGVAAADRQKFLAKVLGLEKYESALKSLKAKSAALVSDATKLETVNQVNQAWLPTKPTPPTEPSFFDLEGLTQEIAKLTKDLASQQTIVDEQQLLAKERQWTAQKRLGDLRTELKDLSALMQEAVDRIKRDNANTDTLAKNAVTEAQAKLDAFTTQERTHLLALDKERTQAYEAVDYRQRLQNEIDKTGRDLQAAAAKVSVCQANITSLSAVTCPTCDQTWPQNKAADKISVAQAELSAAVAQHALLAGVESDLKRELETLPQVDVQAITVKIQQFNQKADSVAKALRVDIESKKDTYRDVALRTKELTAGEERKFADRQIKLTGDIATQERTIQDTVSELTELTRQLDAIRGQIQFKRSELKSIEEKNSMIETQYRADLKRYQEAVEVYVAKTKQAAEAADQLAKVQGQRDDIENAIALVRGFLSGITQELLHDAEQEANKLLGQFKNTSNINVMFPMTEKIRDGNPVYSIDLQIERDGVPYSFKGNLSGGQRTSVHLAVDLAFLRIVGQRQGGKIPGFYMLDESFNGHDAAVKEACMEILSEMAQDRQIFIVDHSAEFKDAYRAKIFADFDGRQTTFSVQQ